jgi:hypothetical protein
VVSAVGKGGGINDPSSGGGDWTSPMSGCGVPSYTAAAAGGPCWALLRLKKKNKRRAAAETATTPPATPPAMAPPLEEEPAELDGEDEVAVSVGSEDEMEEEVEVVTVEDGTTEDVDVEIPLIISPLSTSGRSEKGSVLIEDDRVTKKGVFLPPTVSDLLEFQFPSTWDIRSVCSSDER